MIRLVTMGHPEREIAYLLRISVRPVETHMLHLRRKLNVESRADLVQYAIATRLLSVDPDPGGRTRLPSTDAG